jgi:hypothetical protein
VQNEESRLCKLLDDEAALGFRCPIRDEVPDLKILKLLDDLIPLARFAGNSNLSTQRAVYQPPRCQPIWTSHGHTIAGGASMVIP